MQLVNKWKASFSGGASYALSPSGHALVLQSFLRESFLETFEVRFADGQETLVVKNDSMVTPLLWASDDELVYRVFGDPLGKEPKTWLWVLSLQHGESRPLVDANDIVSVAWSGRPGHLSVLVEPEGRMALFDLEVSTGRFQRLSGFDSALGQLEVYPLFGHSFCHSRQEVVLVAWRLGDYLPDGAEPARKSSPWMEKTMNDPDIQNIVEVRRDGSRVTQREITEESNRKKMYQLFLLEASGECHAVPGTHKSHRPFWSPDGSLIAFQRHDHFDPRNNPGSCGSVWVMRREDGSPMRLGGCGVSDKTMMHPSGVLLCHLEDETIPADIDSGVARSRSSQWAEFMLRDGEVIPE